MKFLYGITDREPLTVPIYIMANYMKAEERRTWLKVVVRGAGLEYITEGFTHSADTHVYCTRNRWHRLNMSMLTTRMLGISFRVEAVGLWNALPADTYLGPCGGYIFVAVFKNRLRWHLLLGGTLGL